MKYLVLIIISLTSVSTCFSTLGLLNGTIEEMYVDSNGYYSYITILNKGEFIGLSGSIYNYPNCVAFSSDYGETWQTIDNFDYYYIKDFPSKYDINFKDIYFNNNDELIVFSDMNKFFLYNTYPIDRNEYLLNNEFSLEEGRSLDFIFSQKIDEEYYIYSRTNGLVGTHRDNSAIFIYDLETRKRRYIPFDMDKLHKIIEGRENRSQSTNYDDEFITKDKCFFATIANYIDVGEEYPISTRSLIKITDFDNPKWEVINLRFSDSTAEHFIYFDDCLNGYLSTYKTYNKEYPRIYKTSDGGYTWEKIYEDNKNMYVLSEIKRANDSTLFATAGFSDVYRSIDNGFSWSRIEADYIGTTRGYEIIDENTLLLAYDKNTIARLTIDSKSSITEEDETNNENVIIYPQPANLLARIELIDELRDELTPKDVTIYNIIGIELDNQKIEIENNKTILWDCSSEEPGIYLINIKHGTEERSVKVVVE